jgi:ornithine carbamoyltransferase
MTTPFIETQFPIRHFIDLRDIPADQLRLIIDTARKVKEDFRKGKSYQPLPGKILAMIFEKSSTRTRVSFEVGIRDLGGHAIIMSERDMQLGRGESLADTARVLSRYVDCIMLRAHSHASIQELAQSGHIPVINGLTDRSHPCQIMADILTFEEHRGPIAGKTIAWVGDGNNVANTFIEAAVKFGFKLRLACPKELPPDAETLEYAKANGTDVQLLLDPKEAVAGADAVITDCWVSMGDRDASRRHRWLKNYQVDDALMAKASEKSLFMHCLPAHRGEEVTASVIDGPQSVVFDEAENRLHAQKGILLWCFKVI